jgi:hypothetical protein
MKHDEIMMILFIRVLRRELMKWGWRVEWGGVG